MNSSKNQLASSNVTPFSNARNGNSNPFAQVLQQLKIGIPKKRHQTKGGLA